MTDYSTLIDAETWAFVEETGRYYPADAVSLDIEGQRRVYDRMCRAFFRGYPPGVTARDERLAEVPVRIYEKTFAGQTAPAATVVYFHGGGFVVGGLDSHDDVCAEICDRTQYRVVSVDYRLAPEHVHPAQFDDAQSATRAVAQRFAGAIVLAGDSAGGNLAAAVAHATRGQGMQIAGQVLIYPGLGGDMSSGSFVTHADAPLLTAEEIRFYGSVRYAGGVMPEDDPTSMPLQDKDFSGLPPTLAVSAECDPLCDDGRAYVAEIRNAGGIAEWVREPGLVHGYLRARVTVRRARESFERILSAIAAMGQGRWEPRE